MNETLNKLHAYFDLFVFGVSSFFRIKFSFSLSSFDRNQSLSII
jgi:hypothetical protein